MKINKIYQGDCLELMKQIEDKSIDMILCDLPYGTTACKWDVIIDLKKLWEQYKRIIKENGVIILTGSQPFTTTLINSNKELFKYELIWNKKRPTGMFNAKRIPMKVHENILVFYNKQPIYNPQLRDKPKESIRKNNILIKQKTNIYQTDNFIFKRNQFRKIPDNKSYPISIIQFSSIDNFSNRRLHPTQKPIKLFEYIIKTYTNEGDLVLDNCIGSGTTAVACIQTKRNFIGIEKEEKYCEIANKRINEVKRQLKLF